VSAATAQYPKRDGGAGEDAQGTPGVLKETAAISGKPVGGLPLPECLLASEW